MVTALTVLLALAGAVMVLRSHRLEQTRRRLVEDVGLLQAALLPALPERVGAACVSAAYLPAEGVAAGGDFFDAFELGDGRTCVIVGDVAGHGRESVPLTAHVHYTLRAYLEAGLSPREALHVGATALGPRLGERTVTAVVGIYDPVTGGLTYACAGHPPPVVAGREHNAGDRVLFAAARGRAGHGAPPDHGPAAAGQHGLLLHRRRDRRARRR